MAPYRITTVSKLNSPSPSPSPLSSSEPPPPPSPQNSNNNNGNNDNNDNDGENGVSKPIGALSFPSMLNLMVTDTPQRFRVVFLCFLSFLICNCDRINISVAILPMAKYYHWNQTTVGLIQSSFFWGYVLTQIPGGYFADKFGAKQVLSFGVITWSLSTVLVPAAASASNLSVLLVVRAMLGFGEGVAMPAVNNIISKWIPEKERARSLSLIYSGMYLGSVVGLSLCPPLIVNLGWQSVFYIFGTLGFVWWVFWQIIATSSPQLSKVIKKDELKYILKYTLGIDMEGDEENGDIDLERNMQSKKQIKVKTTAKPRTQGNVVVEKIPWKELLTKRPTYAIIIAHTVHCWGYFVLLTWLPTYFNQQLGFDLAASSFLSILPWLAMFISANVSGVIADSLRARGMSITMIRKLMQSIGLLGPATFLALVSSTSDPSLAVAYMTSALALGAFTQNGVYSNHQDIGPQYAGILLGIR